jgi:ABC-type uncharacterized transport system permease subunit
MFNLPVAEQIIFNLVVLVFLAAGVVGVLQLRGSGEKYKRLLMPLVALAISLESVQLICRAIAIKGVPLTGLFDSMIVLTMVFGLLYLFFSITIHQVWFGSVMVWVMAGMTLLSALVAEPAAELSSRAMKPWVIAHVAALALSAAALAFATGAACLYLVCRKRLKQKKISKLLGRMPSIDSLEKMNAFGLNACFVLLSFGLASGIGMDMVRAKAMGEGSMRWLVDSKVILVIVTWALLAVILAFKRGEGIKGKTLTYMTIIIFVMLLFAIVGTAIFCGSPHDTAMFLPAGLESFLEANV